MPGPLPIGLPWQGAFPEFSALDPQKTFHAYVHIPFCEVRCGYCDFNTYTSEEVQGVKRTEFHDSLALEVSKAGSQLALADFPSKPFSTVFFGGGTPSLFSASQISSVMNQLELSFGIDNHAEITMELNPDTVDADYLQSIAELGVTRVSIGAQSFDPEVLKTLDRTHRPEKNAIESFLDEQLSLEEMLQQSARTLSQLTNSLALISYPSFGGSYIRHIELIPVSETRILVMLISSSGQIQQHVATLTGAVSEEFLQDLRGRLNGQLSGQPLSEVSGRGEDLLSELSLQGRKQAKPVIETLQSLVDENLQEKIAVSGAANLVRTESDFDGFAPLLEMMEEQVALLKLLRETELEQDGLGISIGSENPQQGLSGASVLIGEYGDSANSARVGILGPTRMNYRGNIASLRAVARYLSKSVNGN